MTEIVVKLKRSISLEVSPEDDSLLQLAAMVLALRDSHVAYLAEITCKPVDEIQREIDASYDSYMESFLQQMTGEASSVS